MANKLTCEECPFCFGDGDAYDHNYSYCHWADNYSTPPCEVEEEPMKYTICYEGFLFEGDKDGWNFHETNSYSEAMGIAHAYPDIVYVDDNEYGVTYHNGEWY